MNVTIPKTCIQTISYKSVGPLRKSMFFGNFSPSPPISMLVVLWIHSFDGCASKNSFGTTINIETGGRGAKMRFFGEGSNTFVRDCLKVMIFKKSFRRVREQPGSCNFVHLSCIFSSMYYCVF
jgi:hypothetical protein